MVGYQTLKTLNVWLTAKHASPSQSDFSSKDCHVKQCDSRNRNCEKSSKCPKCLFIKSTPVSSVSSARGTLGETQEFRFFRFVSISPNGLKKTIQCHWSIQLRLTLKIRRVIPRSLQTSCMTKLKNYCDCGKDPSHDESHTSVFGIRRKCSGRVLRNTTSSSSLFALTTKQRVV